MMSDNLAASFPNVQMDVAGIHLDSYQVCAIASTLVILPTVWLRNLSLLSFISGPWLVFLYLLGLTFQNIRTPWFYLYVLFFIFQLVEWWLWLLSCSACCGLAWLLTLDSILVEKHWTIQNYQLQLVYTASATVAIQSFQTSIPPWRSPPDFLQF